VSLDLFELLGDEEQRDTSLALGFEPLPEPLTLLGIEGRGRLVEQERIRPAEQRDREVEALAIADGEGAREDAVSREPELVQRALRGPVGSFVGFKAGEELEVLAG
jgi:hypothetical protein